MSVLPPRRLWALAAATGLLLAPLPALASDGAPHDPDAWGRASAGAAEGTLSAITAEQYALVTGGCQSFDVTNNAAEEIEFGYGDADAPDADGWVGIEPGVRVRIYTTRALIDYAAYGWENGDFAGTGEDVGIDQACSVPANERYVTRVYTDLFHRAPDAPGLKSWVMALDGGTPRIQVANAITYSNEFRSSLITGVYGEFLGRDADPAGLADWLRAMQSGVTIAQMESGFIASDEYYAAAGSTNAGWVQALYGDVLDRGASQAEVDVWVAALGKGAVRQKVAMGFLLSTERLSTVVAGYYQSLLERDVDAAGQSAWVQILQGGGRDEAIIGGIVASNEYYTGS